MSRVLSILAWIALLAGLVFPTLYPEITNITVLVSMGFGLLLMLLGRQDLALFRQPGIATLMLAGAILLLALLPTAKSIEHVLAILVLAPLWFAFCYALVVNRIADRITPLLIGTLALLGALGGAGISGYEVVFMGARRGGWLVNNPIHLADLTVILGFVALVGLYDRSPWRWLMLLGPVAALAAVFWSGSRGPLLAAAALTAVAGAYLVFTLWHANKVLRWAFGLAAIFGLAASPFVEIPMAGRVLSARSVIGAFTESDPASQSLHERAIMYQSALGALAASPVYGHGMIEYTAIAAKYGPEDNPYKPRDHLHSDIADFAVIGGGLGLLSYLLILSAPIVGGFRARGPALYLGLVLSSGYLVMGLTNAMIGVLTQTVLFGVVTALIGVLASRKPAEHHGCRPDRP